MVIVELDNENLMPKINGVYFQWFKFVFGDFKMMIVRYRTRGCAVLKIKKATLAGAALLLRG